MPTSLRVASHRAVFHDPPKSVPARDYYDGPLLGNGDLGVVIGGSPEKQQFWLSKCDFWRAMPRYPLFTPVNIGWLEIGIPALEGAQYYAEQILNSAEVKQAFTTERGSVSLRCWTPAGRNALVVELSCIGDAVEVEIVLKTRACEHATARTGTVNGFEWLTRRFDDPELDWPSEAAVALRVDGGDLQIAALQLVAEPDFSFCEWDGHPNIAGEVRRVTLREDSPVRLIAEVATSHETADPLHEALSSVSAATKADLACLRESHLRWWHSFWSESEIEIDDDQLELYYYGSFYIMACCSRNRNFAPAISGVWTPSDHPNWGADYHMNYNHQAPWWGCYAANHIGITEPYDTPLLQYIDRARHMAGAYLGKKGILFCVGIGPLGSCSCWEKDHHKWEDDSYDKHFFAGQKSNASWGAVNMVMRWRSTRDEKYAQRVYPYLLELANFWEDYLVSENGRYVIVGDAIHESNSPDVNNVLALGLLRSNLQGTIEIGGALERDLDRHDSWRHILTHLSGYPVYERGGKTVFRYSEVGQDWEDGACVVGLQHLYPADTVDLDSDPELLRIARNSIDEHPWGWDDNNHTMTMIPCAARIGYDPEAILRNLRERTLSPTHTQPNLYLKYGGGGIEACSTITASLQEMLLQSALGVVRVFANWPNDRDARFTNLRAYGAFLISAQLTDGVVRCVQVTSEKGQPFTMVNPWPGHPANVDRDGTSTIVTGDRWTLTTQPGETFRITSATGQKR